MIRKSAFVLLTVVASLAVLSTSAAARPFPETGYSVYNARFLDYFDHRGAAKVLGYPISREFDFLGTRVQFFQRAVLQQRPDGSVGLLNILDEGLLPYTHINGSTFPAPSPAVTEASPSPADPDYGAKAIDFVRANAPDSYEGLKTNFNSTFLNTVSYEDAFPRGDADPSLLPLVALEIWGLPTSKPAYDPNNSDFVYLRFQRGIMHFDRTTGITQGILIGDYLKSVITGQGLPLDLGQEARSSNLYQQYTIDSISGMVRPGDLTGTNLFSAFERDGIILPTPQPIPTAAPVAPAPAATAVPPAPQIPAAIAVTGSSWFVEQTNNALNILSTKAPAHYSNVRRVVHRIAEAPVSSFDAASLALNVAEGNAFAPEWRSYPQNQAEWYAGLIVHNAVHIEQAMAGRASTGYDADREAQQRQRDVLAQIDTTTPSGQFQNLLTDVINGRETLSCWDQPRRPGDAPTPTP